MTCGLQSRHLSWPGSTSSRRLLTCVCTLSKLDRMPELPRGKFLEFVGLQPLLVVYHVYQVGHHATAAPVLRSPRKW